MFVGPCIIVITEELKSTRWYLLFSTCFEHYYAHYQELPTMMLITTMVISFCKVGSSSVNVKLWFLVVYVWCEVFCRLVVAGNMFLLILILILIAVSLYAW